MPPRLACDPDDIPASRSRTSSSKYVHNTDSWYERICNTRGTYWYVTRASVMGRSTCELSRAKDTNPNRGGPMAVDQSQVALESTPGMGWAGKAFVALLAARILGYLWIRHGRCPTNLDLQELCLELSSLPPARPLCKPIFSSTSTALGTQESRLTS